MVTPVFPPKSKEFVAVKVAPPVKVTWLTAAQLIVGAPEATLIVPTAPLVKDEEGPTQIGAEDEPAHVKALVMVCVAAEEITIRFGPVTFKLAKVLAPEMEVGPPPALAAIVTVL